MCSSDLRSVVVDLPCVVPAEATDVVFRTRWFGPVCGERQLVAWDEMRVVAAARRATRPVSAPASEAAVRIDPQLCLWRAATDNDGIKLLPELRERIGVGGKALTDWLAAGLHERPADELVQHRLRRDGNHFEHTVVVPEALADLPVQRPQLGGQGRAIGRRTGGGGLVGVRNLRQEFLAQDGDGAGRLDADLHALPVHGEHAENDVAIDDDALLRLAGENEHGDLPASARDTWARGSLP